MDSEIAESENNSRGVGIMLLLLGGPFVVFALFWFISKAAGNFISGLRRKRVL